MPSPICPQALLRPAFAPLVTLLLAACGGGAGGEAPVATTLAATPAAPTVTAAATGTTDAVAASVRSNTGAGAAARRRAASATAGSANNDCTAIRPFYWEIGDSQGASTSGSVGRTSAGRAVRADTKMRYASASKWIYAAYVAERRGGNLQGWDERMLSMQSGYTHFSNCRSDQSVDACLAWRDNDQFDAATDGHFFYNGGHMQKHASLIGLGAMDAPALAAELRARLGQELDFGMLQASPAGGVTGTPATYAQFLRKMIGGELALGGLLGVDAVCASTNGCSPGDVLATPSPTQETWHYSIGHWVEDDPRLGDGAFSSAGAFGFYPWIDASRQGYGMVARDVGVAAAAERAADGAASARCGRLIRRAWTTGVAQ